MKKILSVLFLISNLFVAYGYVYEDFESYTDTSSLNAQAPLYLPDNYGYGSASATLVTEDAFAGDKCVKFYRSGYPNYTVFGFKYTSLAEGKVDMSGYAALKIRYKGNASHAAGYNLEFQIKDKYAANITDKIYIPDGALAQQWQTIEVPITSDSKWQNVGYILFTDRKDNYGITELYIDTIELVEKGVNVNAADELIVSEQGQTAQYQLSLRGSPAADVIVTATAPEGLLISSGGEFLGQLHLTFNSSNWNVPVDITVMAPDDQLEGYDKDMEIVHTSSSSSDPVFDQIDVNPVVIRRVDNDYPVSQEPVKVFLLAGQSNMQGAGYSSELEPPYTETNQSVSIYFDGRWRYLEPGMGASDTRFGPELSFARQIAGAMYEDNIAFIKFAVGGTSLAYHWKAPDASGENAGPLYTDFTQIITDALSWCTDYEIVGMIWQQGESDGHGDIVKANAYEQNLVDFINAIRGFVVHPSMPFVIGEVSDSPVWLYGDIVRAAQSSVAGAMENVSLVSSEGLTILSDQMHYDTEGTLELGRRFAFSMLDILEEPGEPVLNKPQKTYGNVSVGKFYKFSQTNHAAYQDIYPCLDYSDGSMLTDETLDQWVGWYNTPVEIVLDLGKTYDIDTVRLNARSETSASVYYPSSLEVYVRENDAQPWSSFGDPVSAPENTSSLSQSWLTAEDSKTAARYVKYSITGGGGGNQLLSEIEVYGDILNEWKSCPEYGFYNGAFPVEYHGYLDIERHETITDNKLAMVLWYHQLNPAYSGSTVSYLSSLYNHKTGLGMDTVDYRYLTIGWLPTDSTAADVAQGSGGYDSYFRQWFTDSIDLQYRRGNTDPIWLRPMNEMNGGWTFPGNTSTPHSQWGGDPLNFRRGWRRMYNIAEQVGAAERHIFLWAPNGISYPAEQWNMPDKYYPGDQYVDWVGLSLYPQSDIPYPKNILHGTAGAGSFDFVNNWTHKPLMIAEGTWKKDLERCDGIKWINQWFDMKDIPRLKAAVWFHFQKDSANPEETGKSDMDGYDEDELRVFRYRAAKSSVIKELAANNIDFNDDGRADLYDYSVVASAWLTDNTGNHVYTEINGLVVLEAENYSCLTSGSGSMAGVAWQNLEGGNAVGSFMQALPDSGLSASNYADCPAIDYLIFFENTGDYYLDLKASAPDSDGRKFYVMFDGQYAGEFDAKIFFNFSWEDSGIILNIPQAGIYKLSIAAAQDGLKLDRILLSNDPAYNSSTEPLETDNWQGPFVDGDFDADGIVGFSDMEVLIRQWIR